MTEPDGRADASRFDEPDRPDDPGRTEAAELRVCRWLGMFMMGCFVIGLLAGAIRAAIFGRYLLGLLPVAAAGCWA